MFEQMSLTTCTFETKNCGTLVSENAALELSIFAALMLSDNTNTMKNLKPNKERLLQSIYDNGIEWTCNNYNLTEADICNIIDPKSAPAPKIRKPKATTISINTEVSSFISKNYDKLRTKYVNDKGQLSMCQDSEDIFNNTLLKVLEESNAGNVDKVLDLIEYRLRMVNFQIKQDQKELYKHQIYLEDALPQES